jgi:hypothetical protein
MSGLPDYIPAKAPGQTVTDLSGKLSLGQLGALDNMGKTLNFKARVIILPKSYKAANPEQLHSLAKDVAAAWHVEGNRLLLVVDLSGKKLRAIAGSDLSNRGITNEYLQRTVWPNYFYPNVRKGDIESALTNSLQAIQQRQLAFNVPRQRYSGGTTNAGPTGPIGPGGPLGPSGPGGPTAIDSYTSSSPMIGNASPSLSGGHANINGLIFLSTLLVVALAVIFFAITKSRKDKNSALTKALNERLGKLYATADDLGQASEYIAPQSNKEVALNVSAFFEKLQALDKANDEIEKLTAGKHWGNANEALLPALKLTDKLNSEGSALLENVSAITGGVDSMKIESPKVESPKINSVNLEGNERKAMAQGDSGSSDGAVGNLSTAPKDKKSSRIKINENTSYQRPAWTYEEQYNQPIFGNSAFNSGPSGGIFAMLFLLNQMDTGRRLDHLEGNQWLSAQEPNGFRTSGASAGTSNNSSQSANSSANNNHSSFDSNSTDSGGDWSSSSSSSDSSFSTDSGGDWGTSSDSGSGSDLESTSASDSGSDSGFDSGSDSGSDSGFDSDSGSDSGGDW